MQKNTQCIQSARQQLDIRLDSFLLEKLAESKVIDEKVALSSQFKLAFSALQDFEHAGYFTDRVPDICLSSNPPKWCWAVQSNFQNGRVLLLDSLTENGNLQQDTWQQLRKVAQTRPLSDFAGTLFQEIHKNHKNWKAEKGLEILDTAFTATSSTTMIPVPGSSLDIHCQKNPQDPICWVVSNSLASRQGINLSNELVITSLLHDEGILDYTQTSSIYKRYHHDLTAHIGLSDDGLNFGVIIVVGRLNLGVIIGDALISNYKERAELQAALGRNVGLYGPDSPWAEICKGSSPPRICQLIHAFPREATLTSELVIRKLWPKKEAVQAWEEFGQIIDMSSIC